MCHYVYGGVVLCVLVVVCARCVSVAFDVWRVQGGM